VKLGHALGQVALGFEFGVHDGQNIYLWQGILYEGSEVIREAYRVY